MPTRNKSKICIVTCYKQPDYIRGVVLRTAISKLTDYETIIVKNSFKGLFRYAEVCFKAMIVRFKHNPDIYLITFRGYEILPIIQIIAFGKKVIFDEFINPIEWLVYERQKIREKSLLARAFKSYYRWRLQKTYKIISDTRPHAVYSSKLMDLSLDKFLIVPVGADEDVFKPSKTIKKPSDIFEVFYYGSMLPLHGIEVVCQAAAELAKKQTKVHFTLVGGGSTSRRLIENYIDQGASITHIPWLSFSELADRAHSSHLNLAGPFGGTVQARMVITGKAYQLMAAAEPTVIGKIDDMMEFVDKQNCLIVEQADYHALATVISWAMNHPKQLSKIAMAGHRLYRQNFSTQRIAEIIQKII